MLVKRGKCTFVQKVRNVQRKGGILAIVLDNVEEAFDLHNIIMRDDGTGADIKIPSVLIKKEDADIFLNYFEGEHMTEEIDDVVQLSVTFVPLDRSAKVS
jgi:hypothetical protein